MQTRDVVLHRYAEDGTEDGTWRISSPGSDFATGIVAVPTGGVWLSGYTSDVLGSASLGGTDAFVQQRDGDGSVLATRQFGSANTDFAMALALDGDSQVWIAGGTQVQSDSDAFLQRRDSDGAVTFDRTFGTSGTDMAYGIALDSAGNGWLAGTTWGDLEGDSVGLGDGFLRLYPWQAPSNPVTYQFGTTTNETVTAVAVDSEDNAWVLGGTSGLLGQEAFGGEDVFLRRYRQDGSSPLTVQLGTAGAESAAAIAADRAGNVWIAGKTTGALFQTNAGGYDAFVAAFDAEGTIVAGYQFGTAQDDSAQAIALDAFGNIWVAGDTLGDLKGASAGDADMFVRQLARTN